jgi:heat shock protein HslJ
VATTEEMPYGVKVVYQINTNSEVITVEGCGSYVPDYRLSGTWQLVAMGSNTIDASSTTALPFVTFNISERVISGNNGCNTFRGEFSSRGNLLLINKMSSTKMACPGSSEAEFMSVLSEKSFFAIKNDTLNLSDGEKIKMRFAAKEE